MQHERRMDALTADDIDRAMAIDRTEGAIKAWMYLTQRGVPTETIHRVLVNNGTPDAFQLLRAQPAGGSLDSRRR